MGIDFIVSLPCRVKESIPPARLVELIKLRNQANYLRDTYLESGDTRPAAEIIVTRLVQRATYTTQHDSSLQLMLDESSQLKPYESHCQNCLANVFTRPFGCYGSINYPIQPQTENWLMQRLPDDLSLPAGYLLRSTIRDFNYDGQPLAAMRKQPFCFTTPDPLSRVWLDGYGLNVDQILQMLIAVGPLHPEHSLMMAFFLGFIPHQTPLQNILSPTSRRTMLQNIRKLLSETTGQMYDLGRFFLAMATAVNLNLALQVDY